MGTPTQTPSSQPQQPNRPGEDERSDASAEAQRKGKSKDAGNVPQSDDDFVDEGNEGTREDAAGRNVRNNPS